MPATGQLNESAFGHTEALSALMNEFFTMYPGAKSAYSVASALSGTTGLQTFSGQAPVAAQSKWIPYFQGVFYCHEHVKVHFALQGTLQFNTIDVYNNDTGLQLPLVFRTAKTFDMKPNYFGYMVMGHGTLTKPLGAHAEAHWHLTVLTSKKDVFHVCNSPYADCCREIALPPSSKLHIDSLFVPNRRNILGGIRLFVMQHGAVSFRAAASSPELKLVATLRLHHDDGSTEVLDKCEGTGEVFWPYIKVESGVPPIVKTKSISASRSQAYISHISATQLGKKSRIGSASANLKQRSANKLGLTKDVKTSTSLQARTYTIE
ncbi:uncharacterized protein LOC125233578 [Leguminivora glycinivorella]|uniref:uncharacterized protein LOC125233578 n=1 Tax=Leguminivora glycinivorella TaxID=1035111 RepID=UPI00200C97B9|nr:uncharacterized protein LOC125233578 [Leguminivora glycinivorella]